jgi:hypothetical protein
MGEVGLNSPKLAQKQVNHCQELPPVHLLAALAIPRRPKVDRAGILARPWSRYWPAVQLPARLCNHE